MNQVATLPTSSFIVYPDSDGQPMAENTVQLRWIVTLYGNLTALFRQRPDVFVGADLFWYPVEGRPDIRLAPDVLVVLGRPKNDRGSYRQWEEGDTPVTVVFEVVSPGNTMYEWIDKQEFYEDYGVEEYYILDPERNRLHIFVRHGEALLRVRGRIEAFVSPHLGIRFDLSGEEIVVHGPGGQRFLSFDEIQQQRDEAQHAREQAEQRTLRVISLSRKARQGQATSAELLELERLEQELEPGQS